jgi:hypothetical protein
VPVAGEMYVHVARGLRFDGQVLTLMDLAPSTIWAAATPAAAMGYLPTGAYLDRWAEWARRSRRPGASRARGTLSLLDADARLAGPAVVGLRNPHVTADGLAYDVEVQEGMVPAESGACLLFLELDPAPSGDAPVRADAPPAGPQVGQPPEGPPAGHGSDVGVPPQPRHGLGAPQRR